MAVRELAFGLLLLLSAGLFGCGSSGKLTGITADDDLPTVPSDHISSTVTEMTALADTREEAEKIAELYGIELSTYSYGVAVYVTDKTPEELMELGRDNHYPSLTPNSESYLHTDQ